MRHLPDSMPVGKRNCAVPSGAAGAGSTSWMGAPEEDVAMCKGALPHKCTQALATQATRAPKNTHSLRSRRSARAQPRSPHPQTIRSTRRAGRCQALRRVLAPREESAARELACANADASTPHPRLPSTRRAPDENARRRGFCGSCSFDRACASCVGPSIEEGCVVFYTLADDTGLGC